MDINNFIDKNELNEFYKFKNNNTSDLDWTERGQDLRHRVILKKLFNICNYNIKNDDIIDWGSGFSDFYNHLKPYTYNCFYPKYKGIERNGEFVLETIKRYPELNNKIFNTEDVIENCDHLIICGTFNVGYDKSIAEYVLSKFELCNKSLIACFLSNKISPEYRKPEHVLFDACELIKIANKYTRLIDLDHSYLPHDFCITMKKDTFK